MSEQVSLFINLNNEQKKELEKLRIEAMKAKRLRFKNPTYIKYYKEDTHTDGSTTEALIKYSRMNQLYIQLANYFRFPTKFENKKTIPIGDDTYCIDTGIIRTYQVNYTKEKYTHKGDDGVIKTYKGEEFFLNFAEVKGTEDLGINERLFVHEELMRCIEDGYTIEKLNMWLEELVCLMQNGFTAELLIILLLNLRFKDAC